MDLVSNFSILEKIDHRNRVIPILDKNTENYGNPQINTTLKKNATNTWVGALLPCAPKDNRLIRPLPVTNFWHILAIFGDILFVFDQLVLQMLFDVGCFST